LRQWLPKGCGLLFAALLAACAGDSPTRFYTLSGLPESAMGETVTTAGDELTVGVDRVVLPGYLQRPQIVTRSGANRMMLAEFDIWIEPLEPMVTRRLADNLSILLASDRVLIMPTPRAVRFDYQVDVEVLQFDAGADEGVVLDALWSVSGESPRALRQGRARITEPVAEPQGHLEVAAAMSRSLERLSREIAFGIAAEVGG
jgi:uncharacterized lipoprotein YmbA